MLKRILRCAGFSIAAVCVLLCVYRVLSLKDTSGFNTSYNSAVIELKNTDKNLIDVMVMGSSHAYNSVYPAILYRDYGIASFDLTVTQESRESTYYYLKNALKKQSPKVVLVEMFGLMFEDYEEEGNLYRNVLALGQSVDSYRLSSELDPDNAVQNTFGWSIVHTRYKELKEYDFKESPENSFGRGAVMGWGEGPGHINPTRPGITEVTPIDEANKAWIDRLIELSREEDFELVFFLAPFNISEEGRKIVNGAKEYASECGIEFIDFLNLMDEIGFDPGTDMRDDFHHCNPEGAEKVTGYLGEYLSENYILENHNGEKAYFQWDKDLDYYNRLIFEHEIEAETDDGEYLKRLASTVGITVVLSLEGEYGNTPDYLEYFGIDSEEATENGGKWVFRNGKVMKLMDNRQGETVTYELSSGAGMKFSYDVNNPYSDILYILQPVVATDNGLNVCVYDDLMERFVSIRGIY